MTARSFLVTVTVLFELLPATEPVDAERFARRIADRLMSHRSVVTVRVERDGRPSVYRVDVEAASPHEAAAVASRLSVALAADVGCELLSVDVVREDERPSYQSDE